MLDKIKNLKDHPEILDTMLVGGATLFASVFSYLLQFVLGRKLSVVDYGTFNTLLSLSSLVGVFAAVFGVALVKVVAELFVLKKKEELGALLFRSLKFSLVIGGFLFLVLFVLRNYISNSLNIGDGYLIGLFGVLIGLSFFTSIPNSYLQGMQLFKKYSIFHILNMFSRFVIPTILVFAGFGLRGVFVGIPLAAVLSLFIGFFMVGIGFRDGGGVDVSGYFKKVFNFASSVVLVNLSLMSLNNVDLILVKKYFSPVEAGYYAGTMTLGKILLFGAGAVSIVMFPKITALYASGGNYLARLKKLLVLLVVVLVAGVFCYQIFPGIITTLFFGEAFENSVKYLPLFSIFVAFYVLVNFLVLFFLAIDKKKVGFLLLPGVLAQYVLLNLYHSNLFEVIKVNIGVSVFILVLLSVFFKTQFGFKSRTLIVKKL